MAYTNEDLKILQALPLDLKIRKTKERIKDWYRHFGGDVYVSFSGGKDSTVLLHIVREMYPDVPAVFVNTGLEYPELRHFAESMENVEVLHPKMPFDQVITKYGYPLVGKEVSESIYKARKEGGEKQAWRKQKRSELLGIRKNGDQPSRFNKQRWLLLAEKAPFRIGAECCEVMKKRPSSSYCTKTKRKPYLGTMAEESDLRRSAWLHHGCNAFNARKQSSQPLSFWREQDVLEYIDRYNIEIAPVYGDIIWVGSDGQITMPEAKGAKRVTTGCNRTGCMFCAYGMHREKDESRFERMKHTHPRLYEYSIGGGQWIDNPDYIDGLSDEPDEIGWIPWNPERIWVPSKKGLGMGFVFDFCNELYGKKMWRY